MRALRFLPLLLPLLFAACEVEAPAEGDDAAADSTASPYIHAASDIEAGRYFVIVAGCNDCHTPGFLETPGSIPEAQWLTGLPIGFRGPWGTSYPRNLRLTVQDWDEEMWVTTLRTRHALPPMPWHAVNNLSERDARAVYRYIRSLGPTGQQAPDPVPPGQEPATPYFDFVPQHMERMPSMPPGTTPPPAADTAAAPAPTDTAAATQ
jgi:hypothetical protein